MLERLKNLFAVRASPAHRPALPACVRLYAVGDVHGQDDLLEQLLDKIAADAASAGPGVRTTVVMLGDYIDRGLGSARVIERLASNDGSPFAMRFLKGNHEEAMLDFLNDAEAGPVWVQYGGGETMASYGVKPPSPRDGPDIWQAARADLCEALPPHHRAFFDALEPCIVEAPYLFVHAGIDPARSLAEQNERDFYWIRERFLQSSRPFEYHVVHGHTPEPDYHHDHRRIGIDTGAYLTGVLTAVRLEGETVSFLQTRRGER